MSIFYISMVERKRENFILNETKNADIAAAMASIFNEIQKKIINTLCATGTNPLRLAANR